MSDKKRASLLGVLVLVALAFLPFGKEARAYFYDDGNKVFRECQQGDTEGASTRLISFGFCFGYIMGAVDAVLGAGTHKICIPDGVQQIQLRDVVIHWLADHAEKRHYAAEFLVIQALEEKFPCN